MFKEEDDIAIVFGGQLQMGRVEWHIHLLDATVTSQP